MSKHNRPRLSLKGDQPAPTTEPIEQAPEETRKPMQESKMETNPNPQEAPTEATKPTDKEMAQREETQHAEQMATRRREDELAAERNDEPVTLLNLAGKGHDALHEAMRQANLANKPKPYVPPAMTDRQLSAREEEFEAGRRSVARAEAQRAARPQPKPDVNEGFTTPVHRPGNLVPDPTIPSGTGSVAGTREFGADAP